MRMLPRLSLIILLAITLSGCFTNPSRDTPPARVGVVGKAAILPGGARTDSPGKRMETHETAALPRKTAGQASPASDIQADTAPAGPGDVWQRIRKGFSLEIPRNRRIDQLMHVYRDQQRMDRIQRRAAPWLRHIANELEKRGLPLELALLPAVESAYQARVFSPRGAAGIWQFMGATGGQYGLERNWWYDGRMDVVDSTRAALDYLDWLHRRYGDWLLALAAYNSGIRTVDRAIRRNKRHGRPTDFWHLRLPRETRSYVPQWLALLRIVRDPARYQVTLRPVPDTDAFTTLTIDKPIDLRVAARLSGIPLSDLVALNPGLKHLHTGSSKGYRLHLPQDQVARFRDALASIPASEFTGWTNYRVRAGDVLGLIARRHGTTVRAIREANGLKSTRIRIGQKLRLPLGNGAASVAALARPHRPARLNRPRTAAKKAPPRSAPAARRPASRTAQKPARGIAYRVHSGDSLWTISRRFNVPVARLAAWNDIAINQTLRPGQVLRIHAGEPAGKGATRIHYRVRKGDSLYLIARRFRVPMKQLQSWNQLSDRYLRPGQKLTLYLE